MSLALYGATTMRESIVVKKDYGPISYAEDYYRLYSMPMYFKEEDLLQNIGFLKSALDAPFDFVHRALCIVETKKERELYENLLHMQFNYLITQNYIYLAGLYDKGHYYYYNSQFKKDISNSFNCAETFYKEADIFWKRTEKLAKKVIQSGEYIELDVLLSKAYKISQNEISYSRTIKRKLKELDEKRVEMSATP